MGRAPVIIALDTELTCVTTGALGTMRAEVATNTGSRIGASAELDGTGIGPRCKEPWLCCDCSAPGTDHFCGVWAWALPAARCLFTIDPRSIAKIVRAF